MIFDVGERSEVLAQHLAVIVRDDDEPLVRELAEKMKDHRQVLDRHECLGLVRGQMLQARALAAGLYDDVVHGLLSRRSAGRRRRGEDAFDLRDGGEHRVEGHHAR